MNEKRFFLAIDRKYTEENESLNPEEEHFIKYVEDNAEKALGINKSKLLLLSKQDDNDIITDIFDEKLDKIKFSDIGFDSTIENPFSSSLSYMEIGKFQNLDVVVLKFEDVSIYYFSIDEIVKYVINEGASRIAKVLNSEFGSVIAPLLPSKYRGAIASRNFGI